MILVIAETKKDLPLNDLATSRFVSLPSVTLKMNFCIPETSNSNIIKFSSSVSFKYKQLAIADVNLE